jgi:tetratricopeptide (TPR) repeat protein
MRASVPEGTTRGTEVRPVGTPQKVYCADRSEKGVSMTRAFTVSSLVLAALLVIAGCSSGSGDLSNANTQRRFGVRMAKMNLWREARFRFERATQIEPQNAMAHNNLAVAYEATGDFDAAAREYREALRLDRSNQYIQKNYSRFVEFTQKAKKRQQVGGAAAPGTPSTTSMPVTTTDAVTTDTATTNPPEDQR